MTGRLYRALAHNLKEGKWREVVVISLELALILSREGDSYKARWCYWWAYWAANEISDYGAMHTCLSKVASLTKQPLNEFFEHSTKDLTIHKWLRGIHLWNDKKKPSFISAESLPKPETLLQPPYPKGMGLCKECNARWEHRGQHSWLKKRSSCPSCQGTGFDSAYRMLSEPERELQFSYSGINIYSDGSFEFHKEHAQDFIWAEDHGWSFDVEYMLDRTSNDCITVFSMSDSWGFRSRLYLEVDFDPCYPPEDLIEDIEECRNNILRHQNPNLCDKCSTFFYHGGTAVEWVDSENLFICDNCIKKE